LKRKEKRNTQAFWWASYFLKLICFLTKGGERKKRYTAGRKEGGKGRSLLSAILLFGGKEGVSFQVFRIWMSGKRRVGNDLGAGVHSGGPRDVESLFLGAPRRGAAKLEVSRFGLWGDDRVLGARPRCGLACPRLGARRGKTGRPGRTSPGGVGLGVGTPRTQ